MMDVDKCICCDLVLDEIMSGEVVTENGSTLNEYDFLIKFLALGK